ncbi:MAG: PAS domain S-box protein [Candidatus Bathyarchaeota archaeon]|nr:MAG: PAS domain S-box protein [Candidatus Bathyarchaeota archaeon]
MENKNNQQLSYDINEFLANKLVSVLCVDDEEKFLKTTKQLLELKGGFTVELAFSVDEALQKMSEKTFDAIVSDYQMPLKSGLDFLKQLRENRNDIPFILFTGKDREEVAIKALNLGADRYFNKFGSPETVYGELIHGIRHSVAERKVEEALRQSEEKYRTIVELSPDGIVSVNAYGIITSVNQAVLDRTGFSKEDFLGKHFTQLAALQKEPPPNYTELIDSFLNGKFPDNFDFNYTCKDGTQRSSDARIGLLKQKGELVGLQVIFRDITEQKQMEQKTKESEEKFRTLAEQSPNMIFINQNGNVVYANQTCAELMGYTKDELYSDGFNFLDMISAESRQRVETNFLKHMKGEEIPPHEYSLLTKNGKTIDTITTTKLIKYNGQFAILGTITDITEHKKIIKKLKRHRKMVDYLTEKMGVKIATITPDFRVEWANAYVNNKNLELTSKRCYEIFHNRNDMCPECGAKEVFETGRALVVHQQKVLDPDGQSRWLEVYSTPIKENGKTILALELAVDISRRKEMVNSLRENETKLRALLDTAHVIVQSVDANGKFVYVNEHWKKSLGYTDGDLKNLTLMDIIRKDYHEHCMMHFKKVISGELVEDAEAVFLTKNRKEIIVRGTAKPIYRDGKIYSTVGVFLDITESKKTEENLRKTLMNLSRLNEKLGVVGKLTRHDARNKLSVILNNVFIAKKRLTENLDPSTCLDAIEAISVQIGEIFEFARICEKVGTEDITYIDVCKSVNEAIMLLSGSDNKKFVNNCDGLVVLADSLLRQMFYNLMDNSLIHGKNVTQIKFFFEELENKLMLVYEDDGGGIPKPEKNKIFNEGYGKGTGYGLYLIKKTCESYGWAIEETGVWGKGAKFCISIPEINEYGKKCYTIN